MNKKLFVSIIGLLIAVGVIVQPSISNHAFSQEKKVLKIGYFPNINHAQAVIGVGNGDFQKANKNKKTALFCYGDNLWFETHYVFRRDSDKSGYFRGLIQINY